MIAATTEQIAKLPKWAREYITSLTRERDCLSAEVKRLIDQQTPSPFYVDDWYSPTRNKRYIQSPTNRITIEHVTANVKLDVFLAPEDDGQREHGVEIIYGAIKRDLSHCPVAIVPRNMGSIQLVHRDNL